MPMSPMAFTTQLRSVKPVEAFSEDDWAFLVWVFNSELLEDADPVNRLGERELEGAVVVPKDQKRGWSGWSGQSVEVVVDASSWREDVATWRMLLTSMKVSIGLERASATTLAFPSTYRMFAYGQNQALVVCE